MPAEEAPALGSETYFRQLCEHAGVAMIATDPAMQIRVWNAAAASMFGAAADRMVGTSVERVIPRNRRRMAERMLRRAINDGETFQFEFADRDARGLHRELAGTVAPVLSETGVCLGAAISIRDITRRISLERQLQQSRKMASLGELAGAVAHHFNNILGGVITSVDYAHASNDPTVVVRVLTQVGEALQRAVRLISGMQAFAEGDRRNEDLCDLTEIVTELVASVKRTLEGTAIEFRVTLPELPPLPCPRVQLRTILRNVVQNAIEAMPEGGELHLELALEDDSIIVEITDTGCGLDEDAATRIFEPFWTTKDRNAPTEGDGLGLGLAIAHGLVQMIGGEISVRSEPNKGSCFKISFPRPATTSQ